MREEACQGIVLKCSPYRERGRLLVAMTEEAGLVKFILSGIRDHESQLQAATTPFALGEYIYQRGHSDLHRLREASLIDSLSHLKSSFRALDTAATLGRLILSTQLPGKPSPLLFQLLKSFFLAIPQLPSAVAIASFSLKLARLEGVLAPEDQLQTDFIREELPLLNLLTHAKNFSELVGLGEREDFLERVILYTRRVLEGT